MKKGEEEEKREKCCSFHPYVRQACWDARGGEINGRPENSHSSLCCFAASSPSSSSYAGQKLKASLYAIYSQCYPEVQQMYCVCVSVRACVHVCVCVCVLCSGIHSSVWGLLPVDFTLCVGRKINNFEHLLSRQQAGEKCWWGSWNEDVWGASKRCSSHIQTCNEYTCFLFSLINRRVIVTQWAWLQVFLSKNGEKSNLTLLNTNKAYF